MAGALDAQLNLGVETVAYGTAVTPSRSYEWDMENSSHNWDPMVVVGTGMQPGDGGFARADRSAPVIGRGSGSIGLDFQTKGMGLLLNGPIGAATTTLVSGTTYQHVFSGALATSLLSSYTGQYGVVRSDASGTVDVYTYLGMIFDSLSISCAAGEQMKMTTDWDAKARTEATALASAAYPAGLLYPFHYGQIQVAVGGTLTLPTTTALASGLTPVNDVKSFQFDLKNNSDLDRWVFGSRNQPRVAKREGTLALTTEYNGVTYDQAQSAHTTLPVTITATSDIPLSTGFATVQLVFPATKISSSNRPQPSTSTPTVDYSLDVRKPATGAPFYIILRSSDAAL